MTEESSARPVVGVDGADEPLAAARFAASLTARLLVGDCPKRSSGSTTHGLHQVSGPVAAVPVVTGAGR